MRIWESSQDPFEPGDRIRLKRGDVFTGRFTLFSNGTLTQPIIIGAYGDENNPKPILTAGGRGFVWTALGSGCFQAIEGLGANNPAKRVFHGGQEVDNVPNYNDHDLDTPAGVEAFLEELQLYPNGAWGPYNGPHSDKLFVCKAGLSTPLVHPHIHVFHYAMDLSSSWTVVEDIEVEEAWNALLVRSGTSNITVRRVDIRDNFQHALFFQGFNPTVPANIAILDSTFDRIRQTPIYLQGTNGVQISGNFISNVGGSVLGVDAAPADADTEVIGLEGAKKVTIEHNTFFDTLEIIDDAPFQGHNPEQISVHHNYMANVNGFGQLLSTNCEVHHNIYVGRDDELIDDDTADGIVISPVENGYTAVYNNVFYNVGKHSGIRVNGTHSLDHITYVLNNIVVAGPDLRSTFRLLDYDSGVHTVSDHNLLHGLGAAPNFRLDGEDCTLADLVSAGYDARSVYADPEFVSLDPFAVEDFRADGGSPLLEAGYDPKWLRGAEASVPFSAFDGLWGKEGLAPDIGAFDEDVDSTTLEDGLILSAHFDERKTIQGASTLVDASGLNFHGRPYSGTTVAPGKLRGAAEFDGIDDRAEFGTLGGWNPTTFTISFWMKSTGFGTALNSRIASRKVLLDYYSQTDKVSLEVRAATQGSIVTSASLTEGLWHHVVCTYDDAGDRKPRIYVNGILSGTGNASLGSLENQSSQILLLAKHSTQPNHFKGLLDELNIWRRVLSSTEIAQLYNGGNGMAVQASPALPILGSSTPNFLLTDLTNYGAVTGANATVPADSKGATLRLTGSGWKRLLMSYTVTAQTRLAFDFRSTAQGSIHAIGLDTNDTPDTTHTLQLFGTGSYGNASHKDYHLFNGGRRHYDVPIGSYYTGAFSRLFFANEGAAAESEFSNVYLYESP